MAGTHTCRSLLLGLTVVVVAACGVKHQTTIIDGGDSHPASAQPASIPAADQATFQGTTSPSSAGGSPAAAALPEAQEAGQRYDASRQSGDTYQVGPHDTLYSIAFRNKLDYRQLAAWNHIDPPYAIHPGLVLRLRAPGTSSTAAATAAAGAVAADAAAISTGGEAAAPETPAKTANPQTSATPAATSGTVKPAEQVAAPAATAAKPKSVEPAEAKPAATVLDNVASRSAGGIRWRWPVKGKLIKRFNAKDAIPGIEIAGASGDPVRATADGVVVYSGNGLVGYGELIIIKHDDSLLSAYAHNSQRLVNEGQQVKSGQQIATMGSSGASQVELEFQIRHNGNPVDPLNYLPAP